MKSLALFVATAFAVGSCAAQTTDPVCIIGAGRADLTVANRLKAQGRPTVTFESQLEVGGKCQAFYEYNGLCDTMSTQLTYQSNHFHPLGALLFTNGTYRETLKVINQVGVPAVPFLGGTPRWATTTLAAPCSRCPPSARCPLPC